MARRCAVPAGCTRLIERAQAPPSRTGAKLALSRSHSVVCPTRLPLKKEAMAKRLARTAAAEVPV